MRLLAALLVLAPSFVSAQTTVAPTVGTPGTGASGSAGAGAANSSVGPGGAFSYQPGMAPTLGAALPGFQLPVSPAIHQAAVSQAPLAGFAPPAAFSRSAATPRVSGENGPLSAASLGQSQDAAPGSAAPAPRAALGLSASPRSFSLGLPPPGDSGAGQAPVSRPARVPEGGAADPSAPALRAVPGNLGGAVADIQRAQGLERKGSSGEVAGSLDKLFDFSGRRGGSGAAVPGGLRGSQAGALEGLADLKGADSLDKVRTLAKGAAPSEAPWLYQRAADLAAAGLPAAEAKRDLATIKADASVRAGADLTAIGGSALAAAAAGRPTDALRYTKSVLAYDSLLSESGRPFVSNFPEFSAAVKKTLKSALAASPAAADRGLRRGSAASEALGATPGVRFEAHGRGQMRAVLDLPQQTLEEALAVPKTFAASLALPQSVVSWSGLEGLSPDQPRMSDDFGLESHASFSEFYRSRRAAGDSALGGFWLAAKRLLSSAAAGLWARLRAFVVSLLESLGVLSGGLPSFYVDASAPVIGGLRGLAPQPVLVPVAVRSADPYGLGYRIHRPR